MPALLYSIVRNLLLTGIVSWGDNMILHAAATGTNEYIFSEN